MRMMLFSALLIATSLYALWRGGAPERIVGAAFAIAYGATLLAYSELCGRFDHVEYGVFLVDLLLMFVLLGVALYADRGWPLLIAGLHLATLGFHLLKLLDVPMIRVTYAVMIALWSYPMVLSLAVGTYRHARRAARPGGDLDWTYSLPFRWGACRTNC